jgi:hypothetical protein
MLSHAFPYSRTSKSRQAHRARNSGSLPVTFDSMGKLGSSTHHYSRIGRELGLPYPLIRPGPYAFANSGNALEDVLTLTSALVLSRITLTGNSGQIVYIGQKALQYTRAGTGETWALVYILPSLFVVITIVTLLVSSKGKSRGRAGDLVLSNWAN